MFSPAEVRRVVDIAMKQLGKPYAIGCEDKTTKKWVVKGKPSISNPNPDDMDCSGFSRWLIGQGRCEDGKIIVIPHGCRDQIKFCNALGSQSPRPLDLGFANLNPDDAPDHVVIVIDGANVIEARGKPYNKVIIRPISVWEAQKGFLGFWSVPGVYDNLHLKGGE